MSLNEIRKIEKLLTARVTVNETDKAYKGGKV